MKLIVKIITLFAALWLVGCTNELYLGPPNKPQHFEIETPSQRAAQLYQLTHYSLSGAFDAIIDQSHRIIGFSWYFAAMNNYALTLDAPGGFYQMTLKNAYGKITYGRGPDDSVKVDSLHNFMLGQIGWYVPLGRFYYWLRGVACPPRFSNKPPVMQFDRYGHLIALKQDGWILWYDRYIRYGAYDLPTMIDIQNPQGERTRLVVKDWEPDVTYRGDSSKTGLSQKNRQLLKSV